MLAAMFLGATLCVLIGVFPEWLYSMMPFEVTYTPYDATHVIAQLQLLFFSALAFTWLKLSGLYPPELRSVNLDAEWIYRRAAPRLLARTGGFVGAADAAFRTRFITLLRRVLEGIETHYGPSSVAARSWSTAGMVLCAVAALGLVLVLL
jgi:multicomponent Na+:H+ antiporter subunit D